MISGALQWFTYKTILQQFKYTMKNVNETLKKIKEIRLNNAHKNSNKIRFLVKNF